MNKDKLVELAGRFEYMIRERPYDRQYMDEKEAAFVAAALRSHAQPK